MCYSLDGENTWGLAENVLEIVFLQKNISFLDTA